MMTAAAKVGDEYVNFAFITKNGIAQAPAAPLLATQATYTPDPALDLFMNPGDELKLDMHDTANGFKVVINDLTTRGRGAMTASIANNFGMVKWDPTGTKCKNIPYAFHPMYATSSEHTRVTWTAHTQNIAFSDEIGHFEFCNAVNAKGKCTDAGENDPGGLDSDDRGCAAAPPPPFVPVTGCTATENDFDGSSYLNTWAGTLTNISRDKRKHSTPILFTSPTFDRSDLPGSDAYNYTRSGFESDMPRIERPTDSPNNNCDKLTGANCVNPPVGAKFYPFFSTTNRATGCWWQLGGDHIPGTINDFGGSSTTEWGTTPLKVEYEGLYRYNLFRVILDHNACPQGGS
jgi:hypothetical protein